MTEKTNKPIVQIVLTPEQREQVRQLTGKESKQPKLAPEPLEDRIAPGHSIVS